MSTNKPVVQWFLRKPLEFAENSFIFQFFLTQIQTLTRKKAIFKKNPKLNFSSTSEAVLLTSPSFMVFFLCWHSRTFTLIFETQNRY